MDISLGRFDVPELCTRRSDHLDVLLSGLPQTKGAVRIHFAEGISSEHDFLIAADGIRFTWYGTANTVEGHANSPEGRKKALMEMFAGWQETHCGTNFRDGGRLHFEERRIRSGPP
jgi:hypothetical protein